MVPTWVWVPRTALTRPSRYQPIANFSLVASACMSTMRTELAVIRAASAARKGQSRLGA